MKVSIEQLEDGTYSVTTEPAAVGTGDVGALGAAEGAGMGAEQSFGSLDEAIEAVRAAFGGGDAQAASPMMDGEADFVAGFKQARGGGLGR